MARVRRSLAVLLLFVWSGSVQAEVEVRVRVEAGATKVRVVGSSLRVDGRPVAGGKLLAVPAPGPAVRAGEWVRPGSLPVAAEGPVTVQGRPLTGKVAILPTPKGELDVVTTVPLEAYVERAVAGEIYASWPMEALKAQAVAARTYALHMCEQSRGAPFDVEGSVLSQRYATGPVHERVRDAVRSTRGEFLAFEGEPILAAFHTTAGGQTAASEEVWGESLPYLKRVDSPDEESPEYFWSYQIEMEELRRALAEAGVPTDSDGGVRVLERTPSGRVARVEVAGAELSGRELRQLLGLGAFRSTLFEVRVHGDQVRFLGSGAGHGVGLSQWGAREMARQGRTYREILTHYFRGTRVRSLQDVAAAPARGEGPR